MTCLGLDIGGANLKAADGRGWARSVPFALWREPERLAHTLANVIRSAPGAERIAVTMTGELCDCFRTKAEGVRHILAAVDEAAAGLDVRVYFFDGRFVTIDEARETPQIAAANNWHVLARFVCRFVEAREGLLIDIGSTTTDFVPLAGGLPDPRGWNDMDRLLAGELIYTGIGRTPICAITPTLPWRGRQCPVAAELFATSADAYVVLGHIDEVPDATWTADGRPLTLEFACERLARMICADRTQFDLNDAQRVAAFIRDAQLAQLRAALNEATSAQSPAGVVISGSGEFLARRLIESEIRSATLVSLSERLGTSVSTAAPAHALAVLAQETAEF